MRNGDMCERSAQVFPGHYGLQALAQLQQSLAKSGHTRHRTLMNVAKV
jgi:hypothetical protein